MSATCSSRHTLILMQTVGDVMPNTEEEIQEAIDRATDQTETMEARDAALEELRDEGVLEELLPDTESKADDIEAELEAIKQDVDD